jgi:O-antigen ligase
VTAADSLRQSTAPLKISLLLIGVMWSVPFLQYRHHFPLPLFYSEWLAMAFGIAALYVLSLHRYTARFQIPWVAALPGGIAAVLVIQLFIYRPDYPQQTLLAILYLLWAVGLVWLGGEFRRTFGIERCAVVLAVFVLAGGLLNACAGVLQYYEIRGPLEPIVATQLIGATVYGNLGQANHFATHISLALASLLFLTATSRIPVAAAVPLAGVLLFALTLSGSRGAWIYLGAFAATAAVPFVRLKLPAHRRLAAYSLLLLPAFALAHGVASFPLLTSAKLEMLPAARLVETTSAGIRLELWRDAWDLFLQSPLLGVGHGQFAWHHFLMTGSRDGTPLTGVYHHAHNLFFQLLAETGLAGLLVCVAAAAAWLWRVVRLAWRPENWWLLALLSTLALHSLLEYPLWHAYFLGIAAVSLGLGEPRSASFDVPRTGRVALIVLWAAGSITAMRIETDYRTLEELLFPRSVSVRTERGSIHRELMRIHAAFWLAPYVEQAYARSLPLDRDNLQLKLEFSSRVVRFIPSRIVAYRRVAFLALNGETPAALALLDRAIAVHPNGLVEFAREVETATGADAPLLEPLRAHVLSRLQADTR